MTENTTFNHIIIDLVCTVCYKSGREVRLPTLSEIKAIQNLGLQKYFYNLEAVHLCVYCRALMRKFNHFVAHCERLYTVFDKNHEEPRNIILNLSKSKIWHYSIGIDNPKSEGGSEEKNKSELANQEIPHRFIFKYSEEQFLKDETVSEFSDNDVPLALLNNDSDESEREDTPKRKKRKRKKTVKIEDKNEKHGDYEIEMDSYNDFDIKPVKKCKGKDSKEFSSRMVTETDEYVVIKLNKEQVLNEIREKLTQLKYIDSRYKCERCAKGFNFEDVYSKHMEKHQYKEGYYPCSLCEVYCPSRVSLRGHYKSHTTRYKCKVCGCVRAGRQHLLEHFSLSHSAERRQYRCELCDFVSDKRTTMSRHSRGHKPSEGHACERCAKLCRTEEALRVHRLRHDTSKHYKCPECDKKFIYMSELKKHVHSSHVRREHYCVECDRHFNTADNLKQHFKRSKNHRDPSVFSKPPCPAPRRRPAPSAETTELISCTLCDKVFKSKYVARRHRRTHTDETEALQATLPATPPSDKKLQSSVEQPKDQFASENIS